LIQRTRHPWRVDTAKTYGPWHKMPLGRANVLLEAGILQGIEGNSSSL
jgi:hypothetical protein